MRGYDVLCDLYHGNLRPSDRSFRKDTDFAITMEAFTLHEKWLRETLDEEACKRFEELISCHHNIVNTMSYTWGHTDEADHWCFHSSLVPRGRKDVQKRMLYGTPCDLKMLCKLLSRSSVEEGLAASKMLGIHQGFLALFFLQSPSPCEKSGHFDFRDTP